MEIGLVVTVPAEVTTQCAAVMTTRFVHNAPLHVLLPLRMRTTAVFPVAAVPPTTACAGVEATGAATSASVAESNAPNIAENRSDAR